MKKRKLWTVQEISKLVTAGNNSINRNETFKRLASELGRSYHQCRNKYYECAPNFKTDISNKERETAIRRLLARGVSSKEISDMHGVTAASISLLQLYEGEQPEQSRKPQKIEAGVKTLFDSKEERNDKIRDLSESGKSHRVIAKEVGLGKSMVGDVLRGHQYRKDEPTPQPKSRKVNKENIARFELNFLWGLLTITKQQ